MIWEHDETMPAAQELASKARQHGWEVRVHHDTIDLRRGAVWVNAIYDDGEPVEVRFMRDEAPAYAPGLLDLLSGSVDAFLAQLEVLANQEATAQVEALLRDLPPVLVGDSSFKETLHRLLG